ncbi:hypothetical protein [Sphingobium ummariense]|uniref:Uncharacterized protein n=1 Tax=Sphingobium ummariense RL-3 TaxID=1346791 RepID=T0ISQ6_9SPHN|nr:hypothetical protein [Sphingobium ummariense]EQB31885.1 hypothetical protein M529_12385 [Sphingobium ummariense RL-3]
MPIISNPINWAAVAAAAKPKPNPPSGVRAAISPAPILAFPTAFGGDLTQV